MDVAVTAGPMPAGFALIGSTVWSKARTCPGACTGMRRCASSKNTTSVTPATARGSSNQTA